MSWEIRYIKYGNITAENIGKAAEKYSLTEELT
jgi:hypothetical protein